MNRSRAAFLPSGGDPFSLFYTLKYYKEFWCDEVDQLYIHISSAIEPEVIDLITKTLKDFPKITLLITNRELQHGENLNKILDICKEDYILFIEDDSIIFKHGIVDKYFKLLEENIVDVIGSERTSCHPWITETISREMKLDFSGYGDHGPAYWPCFFWIKKSDLLKTDRDFNTHFFKQGSTLCSVGVPEDMVGDTFVWASLQLRWMGLRIINIPQYHCGPDDPANRLARRSIFDNKCSYMHFGSLSSGLRAYLFDDNMLPLANRFHVPPVPGSLQKPTSHIEKLEMDRRVFWWQQTFNSVNFPDCEFKTLYQKAIQKVIDTYEITRWELKIWEELYMGVINEHN